MLLTQTKHVARINIPYNSGPKGTKGRESSIAARCLTYAKVTKQQTFL